MTKKTGEPRHSGPMLGISASAPAVRSCASGAAACVPAVWLTDDKRLTECWRIRRRWPKGSRRGRGMNRSRAAPPGPDVLVSRPRRFRENNWENVPPYVHNIAVFLGWAAFRHPSVARTSRPPFAPCATPTRRRRSAPRSVRPDADVAAAGANVPAHVVGLAQACEAAFPEVADDYAILADALSELDETSPRSTAAARALPRLLGDRLDSPARGEESSPPLRGGALLFRHGVAGYSQRSNPCVSAVSVPKPPPPSASSTSAASSLWRPRLRRSRRRHASASSCRCRPTCSRFCRPTAPPARRRGGSRSGSRASGVAAASAHPRPGRGARARARPNKIFLLAGNYARAHPRRGRQRRRARGDLPYVFMKPPSTTLTHPFGPSSYPPSPPTPSTGSLELAVVIGRRVKNVDGGRGARDRRGITRSSTTSRTVATAPTPPQAARADKFSTGCTANVRHLCPAGPCITSADGRPRSAGLRLTLRLKRRRETGRDHGADDLPVAASSPSFRRW